MTDMLYMLRRACGGMAIFVIAIGFSGCQAHVAPYEREYLAKPVMDTSHERNETRFTAHVYDSRQGATGADTSTGGGCGCN